MVFFCAQQQPRKPTQWNYYYIGVGTVSRVIKNRRRIWTVESYEEYRRFYNLLIDASGRQLEVLYPRHSDWKKRRRSPYVSFESSKKTHFNVRNPLLVASYDTQAGSEGFGVLESWQLDDEDVRALEALIPNRPGGRKLRTSNPVYPHPSLNLWRGNHSQQLRRLRRKLVKISIGSFRPLGAWQFQIPAAPPRYDEHGLKHVSDDTRGHRRRRPATELMAHSNRC